jgi:putative nucleotidyltransferase with HDIG domain
MHRRGQLFYSVALVFLTYSVSYTALAVMQEGDITKVNYQAYLWFAANSGLLLICYPLIFIFEKTFGFLSDVTLLELSDTNHPALRKLAENAPGTFQHVMMVANLAEEAIRKIEGNPLLMRVGALYHDIGKAGAPAFFVENQAGKSPHDDIPYDKSAEIIIQHVTHGVELAKKYNLPQPIIDFILTHHGTGIVKYFYTRYENEYSTAPDISKFSYPGPAPFTKETAVLMMADAVEAASRTLKEYNEDTIDQLVEKIINSQMDDNQFEEADITFRDISMVKQVFKQKLMNIYHARIEYPEARKKN